MYRMHASQSLADPLATVNGAESVLGGPCWRSCLEATECVDRSERWSR